MVTPRSASAVRNLDSFSPPDTHHCTCVPLSPFVGSRSSYRNQSSPVLACCWLCSFTSCKSALFFLGPWVLSLAVFLLILGPIACTVLCEALAPRPRGHHSRPFHSHTFSHPSRRSEPWLRFDHPSRRSRVLSPHAWYCFTARLVLSPCSFTLLVVLGARPCFRGFPFTARSSSHGFHVLRVVWWSPAPPLFSLPRAARVGRYLQSSASPAVVSRNDFVFHCC